MKLDEIVIHKLVSNDTFIEELRDLFDRAVMPAFVAKIMELNSGENTPAAERERLVLRDEIAQIKDMLTKTSLKQSTGRQFMRGKLTEWKKNHKRAKDFIWSGRRNKALTWNKYNIDLYSGNVRAYGELMQWFKTMKYNKFVDKDLETGIITPIS